MSDVQAPPPNMYLETVPQATVNAIAPCPNISVFRLQHWHWTHGVKKTKNSREALVHNVLLQPDFVGSDLAGVNWDTLDDALASHPKHSAASCSNATVPLIIPPRTPAAAAQFKSSPSINSLPVPVIQCLTLLDPVQQAFTKNMPCFFHYEPYESYCCNPGTSTGYRTYGEAYESKRMLDMHCKVQKIVLDGDCQLPRCVAALMIFSDATQLANFGNAKAWPIRISFGNLSKYERCKPDSHNHFELAFLPSVCCLNSPGYLQIDAYITNFSYHVTFKTRSASWKVLVGHYPKCCLLIFDASSSTQCGSIFWMPISFVRGARGW